MGVVGWEKCVPIDTQKNVNIQKVLKETKGENTVNICIKITSRKLTVKLYRRVKKKEKTTKR